MIILGNSNDTIYRRAAGQMELYKVFFGHRLTFNERRKLTRVWNKILATRARFNAYQDCQLIPSHHARALSSGQVIRSYAGETPGLFRRDAQIQSAKVNTEIAPTAAN